MKSTRGSSREDRDGPDPGNRVVSGASFELRGVRVELGSKRPALDGVDVSIGAGERVAIVGPSGAGKTTLLRLLGATLRPSLGEVRIDGRDVVRRPVGEVRRLRTRLGFVHQDHALVRNLRVAQNVIAGKLGQRGWLGGWRSMILPSRSDLERTHELLASLGVGDELFQPTDRLSGGEAQRVAIARALFQEPRALLADEPVASVDPARSRDLVERLLAVAVERGTTVVASLHDVELARSSFPRILGLRAGRLAFDRPARELATTDLDALFRLGGSAVG